MMKYSIVFTAILLFLINLTESTGQTKGADPKSRGGLEDSVFVFQSPRSLLNPENNAEFLKNAWGADVIFSNNGFGLGFFYQRKLAKNLSASLSFFISEARNTDEFKVYDPYINEYVVPGKINRLFMFPLTLNVQQYFLQDVLFETLRPHVSLGVGPTFIMATPYEEEFFKAFGDATTYTRFASYIGLGADVGKLGPTLMAVNLRYYYIPFGGKGLESIKDLPIKDFGGVFLSLTIGSRY